MLGLLVTYSLTLLYRIGPGEAPAIRRWWRTSPGLWEPPELGALLRRAIPG